MNDWRQKTIEKIRLMGLEVAEHAEDYINANDEMLESIDITLNVNAETVPTITVRKTLISIKALGRINEP